VTIDRAKKACVFCNGESKNPARVKRAASNYDLLIGADGWGETSGGYRHG